MSTPTEAKKPMIQSAKGAIKSILPGSKTRKSLKAAGRFSKTLLAKLPDCIDGNPVTMAFKIVNTIIEICDAVGENGDALRRGLDQAKVMLDIADMPPPDIIKEELESFQRLVMEQQANLEHLTKELKLTRILDYEKYRGDIAEIIKRISDATAVLKLKIQVKTTGMTENIYDDIKNSALDKLNPAIQADFRTVLDGQTLTRETCTEGTRAHILNDITTWANNPQPNNARVYWLTGQAGSGKTTLANTIAHKFAEGHGEQVSVLVATFFCSQQFTGTRNVARILPTIAYQLARKYRPYAHALHAGNALDSANFALADQMRDLLAVPWGKANFPANLPPLLVILDALDEIDGDGGARFLRQLLETVKKDNLRGLKFLVTSRTNEDIAALCKTFPQDVVCRLQDVSPQEADSDIGTYLVAKLPGIARHKPELLRGLQERAQGLFIYASTVIKYLNPGQGLSPSEEIDLLSGFLGGEDGGNAAISSIDQLYQRIMYSAFSKLPKKSQDARLGILYTFLSAAERISPSTAAILSTKENVDEEMARLVIAALHAVIYMKDGRVFWYHASFPDFIFNQARSNFHFEDQSVQYSCDEQAHNNFLAERCFQVMKFGLRFNICNIPSSFLMDDEYLHHAVKVNDHITSALSYSSRNWGEHLQRTSFDAANLSTLISDFLSIRVIFWMEVLNLLKARSQCARNLQLAQEWATQNGAGDTTLKSNLLEVAQFATYFFGSPAAESTPHLYISSLATWRHDSALISRWKAQFARIPAFTHSRAGANVPFMTVKTAATTCAAFLGHNNHIIVSGSEDTSVQIWDAFTGTLLHTLEGHTWSVTSVACSNDGRWIVSGSDDTTIRLWDASTGTGLKVFIGHTSRVYSVALSTDATRIVSGSGDKSVRLWDATTGMELWKLLGHERTVTSVAISGDGSLIVSGSSDGSVRVWNAATGTQSMKLSGHTDRVRSVSISRDAKWIVSGSDDDSVRVWDAVTGQQLHELLGHTDWVHSVVFSNDGQYIVYGSRDGSARLWDAATGKEKGILQGHNGAIKSVAISLDGTQIVSASTDSLHMWDATRLRSQHLDAHTDAVYSVAFSTDGTRIVSGSRDHSMRVWDAITGHQLQIMHGHTDRVWSASFSSDGTKIASGSDDKSIRLWDATTGKQLRVMNGHTDHVLSVSFSGDGTMIASGSMDRSVRIWDTKTGQQLHVLDGHRGVVYSVAFSQDGTRIVSGSWDESVRVWDAITGAELQVMNHIFPVWSVAMSTNGRLIASGCGDGSVQVWDATIGNLVLNMTGHTKGVDSVAFSADGTKLVSGSWDQSVRVWDATTGTELHILNGHTDNIYSVAISNDGKRIASGSLDKTIRVWTLDQPQWILDKSKSNWIVSLPDKNCLMWVPPAARVCKNSYLLLVIRPEGSAGVDFKHAMIGTDWRSCYTPI